MKQLESEVNEVATEHSHLKAPVWGVPEWRIGLSTQLLISAHDLIVGL